MERQFTSTCNIRAKPWVIPSKVTVFLRYCRKLRELLAASFPERHEDLEFVCPSKRVKTDADSARNIHNICDCQNLHSCQRNGSQYSELPVTFEVCTDKNKVDQVLWDNLVPTSKKQEHHLLSVLAPSEECRFCGLTKTWSKAWCDTHFWPGFFRCFGKWSFLGQMLKWIWVPCDAWDLGSGLRNFMILNLGDQAQSYQFAGKDPGEMGPTSKRDFLRVPRHSLSMLTGDTQRTAESKSPKLFHSLIFHSNLTKSWQINIVDRPKNKNKTNIYIQQKNKQTNKTNKQTKKNKNKKTYFFTWKRFLSIDLLSLQKHQSDCAKSIYGLST